MGFMDIIDAMVAFVWGPPLIILLLGTGALIIVIKNIGQLPAAFGLIFKHAFTPTAASACFARIRCSLMRCLGTGRNGRSGKEKRRPRGTAKIVYSKVPQEVRSCPTW